MSYRTVLSANTLCGSVLQGLDEAVLSGLVKDTNVLNTKDYMKWNWNLIFSLLQVGGRRGGGWRGREGGGRGEIAREEGGEGGREGGEEGDNKIGRGEIVREKGRRVDVRWDSENSFNIPHQLH